MTDEDSTKNFNGFKVVRDDQWHRIAAVVRGAQQVYADTADVDVLEAALDALTPDDIEAVTEVSHEVCRCALVKVGGKPTDSRNWNPDCPVHPWDERLQAQSDRAVEMQRRAAQARKAHAALTPDDIEAVKG